MIRILLADDQALIRESMKLLLNLQDDFEVIGEAENGRQALELFERLKPDIILMDIRMPLMNGVEAIELIKKIQSDVKILVLTTFDDDDLVLGALSAGAMGYFLKDGPSEDLAVGIRSVYKGNSQFSSGIIDKVIKYIGLMRSDLVEMPEGIENLTTREKEIFYLLGEGSDYKEIAELLFITEGTVKNYVNRISDQLNVKGRTRLALLANNLSKKAGMV